MNATPVDQELFFFKLMKNRANYSQGIVRINFMPEIDIITFLV